MTLPPFLWFKLFNNFHKTLSRVEPTIGITCIDKHTTFWYLLHHRAKHTHSRLGVCADSTERPLLVYTKYGCRWKLSPKIIPSTPLDAKTCMVISHLRISDTHQSNMWFPTIWYFVSVDSDEPVQPPFKLNNSKWCSVSSLIVIDYSSD